jgi:hypothetical protein
MPKSNFELKVFNPRGESENTAIRPASPRLKDLKGKKIGLIGHRMPVKETFFERLESDLKKKVPGAIWRVWDIPFTGGPEARLARLKEIADNSDGVVISLAISGGSTTHITPEAIAVEKFGKPCVLVLAKAFQPTARFIARGQGLEDLALAPLDYDYVPPDEEIIKFGVAEKVADEVIKGLTTWKPQPPVIQEVPEKTLSFNGANYQEAYESMERFFLQHGWSDGLPLVPPTEEAVNRILEGVELPREHLISVFPPGMGKATVEKIAINAAMAGCLPQYMPLVMAAVETVIDPEFNLVGAQNTSGQIAPLFILSGWKLAEQLNVNGNFCSVGPGWKANTTIGRALKLILMNIGQSWPGINDMKAFGNPFRYVTLIAENEPAYQGVWEPLRVSEGYAEDQPTISVMPAMSWQPDLVQPTAPTVARIIHYIALQGKVKYDRYANSVAHDGLVLISPTAFDAFRREKLSKKDFQKTLYETIQLPGNEVFDGRERGGGLFPQWIKEKHKSDPNALVPLFFKQEDIKICVTGGPGPDMIAYIGTWGYGTTHFVTKPIKLPKNWNSLLKKYAGYTSPTI